MSTEDYFETNDAPLPDAQGGGSDRDPVDEELKAMKRVEKALKPLSDEEKVRVVRWALERHGLAL